LPIFYLIFKENQTFVWKKQKIELTIVNNTINRTTTHDINDPDNLQNVLLLLQIAKTF